MAVFGDNVVHAWCNLRPMGTFGALDSYNISSVTDDANGDYTFNFSDNFANANYAALMGCAPGNGRWGSIKTSDYNDANSEQSLVTYSTSACRLLQSSNVTGYDSTRFTCAFVGNSY